MKKGDYLEAILRSQKSIFSAKDIALLWGEVVTGATRVRIHSYVKQGKLLRLRRGIYAKDLNYDPLELATKIFTPAYVSFETVLSREGIVFQYYDEIFVASYLSRVTECGQHRYVFKKIRQDILVNPRGVEYKNEQIIATKERAFLDVLYINKDYYFDNLEPLNWDCVFDLLPIYENKRMNEKVRKLFNEHKRGK